MTAVLGSLLLLGKEFTRTILQENRVSVAAWLALIGALGVYYLWTISLGAVPTSIGGTGLSNLVYIVYEQTGLAGLGPGRLELREGRFSSFLRYIPGLALASLALLVVFVAAGGFLAGRAKRLKLSRWFAFLIVLPFSVIVIAAWAGQARLLGRHFTPLYPFLLFGLAVGTDQLSIRNGAPGKIALRAFLGLLLFSSLQIRFAPRHVRDDYRSATAEARRAVQSQGLVWWAADRATANYYGLPVAASASPTLVSLQSPFAHELPVLPEPDMIVRSKPDVYDGHAAVLAFALGRGYRVAHLFPAFEIWERSRPSLASPAESAGR
ncbi:MAG: hypothetical protein H0U88_06710 [Chthoniobacterales bacterium]|nr:hypothetical protein [Chthoniobacterales bacterium]